MFKITRSKDTATTYIVDIVADSETDVANLPTKASHNIEAGSTCIVIETSEVYMLNNQDQWVKL